MRLRAKKPMGLLASDVTPIDNTSRTNTETANPLIATLNTSTPEQVDASGADPTAINAQSPQKDIPNVLNACLLS